MTRVRARKEAAVVARDGMVKEAMHVTVEMFEQQCTGAAACAERL